RCSGSLVPRRLRRASRATCSGTGRSLPPPATPMPRRAAGRPCGQPTMPPAINTCNFSIRPRWPTRTCRRRNATSGIRSRRPRRCDRRCARRSPGRMVRIEWAFDGGEATWLALAIALFTQVACGRPTPDVSPRGGVVAELDARVAEPDATPEGPLSLSPIPPEPLFTNLTVPGFPDAVVALPNGARTPRPVLIVIHGSGDRPDWNCDAWRHITSDHGFVLCPRGEYVPKESGRGDDRRYTHTGGAYLRLHLDAALTALAARFAGYVDVDRPLVAGFSLGAA